MEFRGNEDPKSSAEQLKRFETEKEKLETIYDYLINGKDKEGNEITTREGKNRAKQDKKEIKRNITELTNKINVISATLGKHQEESSTDKKEIEEQGDDKETGAEYFGSSMEDISLVASTILGETDKTVEKLDSRGSQNIQKLENAKATQKELGEAKKNEDQISSESKSEAEKLKSKLLELTFPEMVAVDGLDNQQLENKLNEVENFLKINKIDVAFEEDQEIKSDVEKKLSKAMIAIGAYRRDLLQKKLGIGGIGDDTKMPPSEKLEIPKHIDLDLKNNDNLEALKPILEEGNHHEIVAEIMKIAGLKPEELQNFDYRIESNKDKSTAEIVFSKKDSMDKEFTIAIDLSGGKIEKITDEDRLRMFNELTDLFAERGDLIKQRSNAKDKEEIRRIDADLSAVNSKLDSLYKKIDRPETISAFDDSEKDKIKKIGEILRSARVTDSFDYMSGTGSADLVEDTIRKRGGFKRPDDPKKEQQAPQENIKIGQTYECINPYFDFYKKGDYIRIAERQNNQISLIEVDSDGKQLSRSIISDNDSEIDEFLKCFKEIDLEPNSSVNNNEKTMEQIPIEPISGAESNDDNLSIERFDFENISDKEDLSNRLFEFGKKLEESNLRTEREISTDLLLFLQNKSLGHLESAKMQIDKCTNENAKNKLQELIVKCEEIVKNEPKPKEDNKAEKTETEKFEDIRKKWKWYESVIDGCENHPDWNIKRIIENLEYFTSHPFFKEDLLEYGLDQNENNRKTAENIRNEELNKSIKMFEKWISVEDDFMKKSEEIKKTYNESSGNRKKEDIIKSLKESLENLDSSVLDGTELEDNDENKKTGLAIQSNIFRKLLEELEGKKEEIAKAEPIKEGEEQKQSKEQENGSLLGIKIKTAEDVGKMTNDEFMSAGGEAFAKYEELESGKDFETLKTTDEFLVFAGYLNILTSEHDKRTREGRIEVKKHRIASNEEINALDMKSLQEELSRTEIYLNYIKTNKSQEDWFSSEFSDYGLYQQKLENRINEINENPSARPAETPKETTNETAEIETMSDEDIKKETDTDALQEKIDETIDYLKNTENISEEDHSRLSVYIDNLQIRKSELEKILISKGYKKINAGIKDLNKNMIQIERTSETQEIENIKNAKTVKELSDGIRNIEAKGFDGKDIANIKKLKDVMENIFSQIADEKGGKLKNDVNSPDFRNIVTDSAKDATAKSYIVALFAAIENIRSERRIELNVGDKIRMKEKDGQVRDGWIVTKIDGKNAEVQNDKNGEILETTLGELAGWQDDKLMEEAKRIKDKEEEIKLREYELQLNGGETEKDEKLNKLKSELKELKGVKTGKDEKKEGPQTYGEIVENMKKMGEFLEKRKVELSKINSDEQIQKIKDKVSRGEKLSEKETSQYKSMFMAKDEVTISEIGISAIQNADLYKIDLPSLSHEEAMKVLDRRIKASKVDLFLHEKLRSSIRSCNEKISQMDEGRRGVYGAIADGILRAAKHIPIIKNYTYPNLEAKTEQEKKREEGIKEGATVSIKEKKGISEKWKIVKIEGNKVIVEKENRAMKEFKEKDLMKWNSITEKGKFKKGDKIRVMVDGKIGTDWVIENVEDNKILAANDKAKTEKTVKKEDIVSIQEKAADKESFKDLLRELNELKSKDLDMTNIKDMASFDKTSKALKTKFNEMSQKTSYFEGLEDKAKNDIVNVFNIDLNWYNECVRKKKTEEKMKDREQDKKGFNDKVEQHKNLIKRLPDELKDFKESLEKFIEFASQTYHETKYSDEPADNDNEKEEKTLLKKMFTGKEIRAIKDSEDADELIEAVEKFKTELKPQIKDHKAIESCYLVLDDLANDSKRNKNIRKYTRDKIRDEIEKIEDDNAKKYLRAVLEKIDGLITSKKAAVGDKPKKTSKNKSKTRKK
ncbi:MAG: hypothetical protein WC788_03625 [Candidatus Paceibacterota bacterium]|jgi:hypothetical protein